jgi:hypothetical protein
MKKSIYIATVLILGILLSSCVDRISEEILSKTHDQVAPVISDVSPDDGYDYGAYTQISGTVTDLDSDGNAGKVESLTLEIVGISEPQLLEIGDDGNFNSGIMKTYGDAYIGPVTIKLIATDWKGNSKEHNINYSKADGEITSFSIERGNGQVSLSWDGMPGGGGYVYEIRELFYGLGMVEQESSDSNVTYTWTGLDNGKNYSFVISTSSTEDDTKDFTSEIKSIMPLSPLSCTPVVTVNASSVDLLWPELTDADKYVVQRSSSPSGPWETIGITSNNYLRYNESTSALYYFHVYPYSTEAPVEDELIDILGTGRMGYKYWAGGTISSISSTEGKVSDDTGYNHIAACGVPRQLTIPLRAC